MAYDSTRGSWASYATMKSEVAEFKLKQREALGMTHFRAIYDLVEGICRAARPFAYKPYSEWCEIYTSIWRRVANDEIKLAVKPTEKPVKTKPVKEPKKDYNTIGVRFLRGPNLHKVYTYRVVKKAKLRLGEEVVVPAQYEGFEANNVAVVVEIHKTPQDNGAYHYKFVVGRVQAF